jgi:hypothetical protein
MQARARTDFVAFSAKSPKSLVWAMEASEPKCTKAALAARLSKVWQGFRRLFAGFDRTWGETAKFPPCRKMDCRPDRCYRSGGRGKRAA